MPGMTTRREFVQQVGGTLAFLTAAGTTGTAAEQDVPWLAEVQQPPAGTVKADIGIMSDLLADSSGRRIATAGGWATRREEIRRRWLDFLGPMPAPPPTTLSVLSEDRPEGCRRQLVRYESEPGLPVEGYLIRPEPLRPGKHPALVVLHQTSKENIDEVAGVRGPEMQAIGLKLAREGFVVFCPRCFLWQSVRDYKEAVEIFRKRHPATLGMHKMLYDARRGIDALLTLPEVDARRIGATGHSLGAKETLYLAAFDPRIRMAAASEGGVGLSFTNWEDPWYLGAAIKEPGFKMNHHELLALIAPRPFLVIAGESADGDKTWPLIDAALPVYRLYGTPARIGLLNHRQGHTIPPAAFARMAEWLRVYAVPRESEN
jgi:hypothetical protein